MEGQPPLTSCRTFTLNRCSEDSVVFDRGDIDGRRYANDVCGPGEGILSLEARNGLTGLLCEPAGSIVGSDAVQVVLPTI